MPKPLLIIPLLLFAFMAAAPTQAMQVAADARDMPRGLLKTSTVYEAEAGVLRLHYPKWIPGIHGPRNAIENLAEIYVYDTEGNRLNWKRDPFDVYSIEIEVPTGIDSVRVDLTYVCNQPNTNSRSVDSYGNPLLGVINWNTCLLYPDGQAIGDILTEVELHLPEGWQWGSSLRAILEEENHVRFAPVSFEELVDSPLIAGAHFRTVDLSPADGPEHYLHMVAESGRALQISDEQAAGLRKLVREGMALFGNAPFESYHFLLVVSDFVPRIGLEHLRSSLNAVGQEGILDESAFISTANLLSHEYCHSWCGKYHRPAGMLTEDYQTPKDTRLLWVYEGLDQYLGIVLAARAGLNESPEHESFEHTVIRWGRRIHWLMQQQGRRSIPLEDTTSSAYLRRGGSDRWGLLNRPQDYYNEGALLWLEIDAILRTESDGAHSLDDFARSFLGRYEDGVAALPFTESDLERELQALQPNYDWAQLFEQRIRGLDEELALDLLHRIGYQAGYSDTETDVDDNMIATSLGIWAHSNGEINRIRPNSPADMAELYQGMRILGVNNRAYNRHYMEEAIQASPDTGAIELILAESDRIRRVTIEYDAGPRFFEFIRSEGNDLLADIHAPKTQ